jgi:hypothetical protein
VKRERILVLLFCFFVLWTSLIYGQDEVPAEVIPVYVTVYINWNVDQEFEQYKGMLRYSIQGNMELDKEHTKEVKTPTNYSIFPIILYRPVSMTVDYTYLEEVFAKNPGKCPPLVTRYQKGVGMFNLGADPESESRAEFNVRRLGSMFPKDLPINLPEMEGAPSKEAICDYYEFFAAGPWQTIEGKVRDSSCTYKDDDKDIIVCKLGLRFELPSNGNLSGKRDWSTKFNKSGLVFKISLSDLPAPLSDAQYSPDMMPDGDVSYHVIWCFGDKGEYEYEQAVNKKDKERDCEKLQERIDFIKIVRQVYANDRLRKYAKENFKDLSKAIDHYQAAIEKLTGRIEQDNNITSPSEIQEYIDNLPQGEMENAFTIETGGSGMETYMATTAIGKPITAIKIFGPVQGNVVDLITYDGQGGNEYTTHYCNQAHTEWINAYWNYSQEVGTALFWSAVAHEKTHVRQYAKKKHIKSIDDFAERELEAFQAEIDKIKEYQIEMGC